MIETNNKFLGEAMETPELFPVSPDVETSEKFKYNINGFDTFKRAFKDDSLASIAYEKVEQIEYDNKYDIDSEFDMKNVWTPELENEIHPDFKDSMVSRAKNEEHFTSMVDYYKKESAIQRELESYGFMKSIGYGFLPELTNAPLYIGAAAMLPQASALLGSSALLRMVTSGTAGSAIEGLKDILGEQDKHALDYAGAFLFDGAMGAAFGKRSNTFQNIANDMVLRSHGITRNVVNKLKKVKSKEERNLLIQNAYTKHSGEQADKTLLEVLDSNIEYAGQNIVQKAWGAARQDLAYTTGLSESKTMSTFAQKMFPDATLQKLDLDNPDMASARDLLEETMRGDRQTIFKPLIKEYTRIVHNSGGLMGIKPSGQMEREFGSILGEIQLTRSLEGRSIEDAVFSVMDRKGIKKTEELTKLFMDAGKGMEELAIGYHRKLAKAGHEDFISGAIPEDGTYMPYVYNKESFAPLLNKGLKKGHIAGFFKNALKSSMGEDVNEKALNTIAMTFYHAVSGRATKRLGTFDSIIDEILTGKDFTQEVKDLAEQIKESKFSGDADAQGRFATKRTNIDYKYKETFEVDGEDIEVSFRDFLTTDYLDNMDTYARKMSGTTVLRQHGWTNEAELDFTVERTKGMSDAQYDTKVKHQELRKHQETNKIKNELKDDAELVKLRKEIDDIAGRQTDEGIELFKAFSDKIFKSLDPESAVAKALNKAILKNDYQSVGDIIFKELQDAGNKIDIEDSTRLFELMDEFITGPTAKINELELKYRNSMEAKVNKILDEKQKTTEFRMNTKADYDTLRNKVRAELDSAVQGGSITVKQADKDLVRLDTIIKDMSGIATAKDPQGNLNRFYRITHSYNVGRLLGQTFFTMPAEAMNVMWDQGLGSFIDSMPAMKSLLKAYRTGSIDNVQVREIQDSLGMYDEFLSSPRQYEFDHDFNAATNYTGKAGKAVDKIEAWGENFAEFTLMTGGIKPLTAWFQTAHIMGVFKKMRMVAEGGARDTNYKKMVGELGLSKDMEAKVYDNILKHYDNGTMNFKNWDGDVQNVFLVGVKRRTDTLVQMQRLGDKPAWVSEQDYMFKDTFIGKVTMELKQFVMTAYVKQLGRALNRKDQYMIGLIASQMTALTLSYMMKQSLNYAGNPEKLKRSMQPENIVAGTMGMMPQGSVLPMVMNFGSNIVFGQNIMGTSRHNSAATDAISSLPIMDGISQVMGAFSIPAEVVSGEMDRKTLNPVAKMSGISNHWLTKAFFESTQNK